jgi:predicted TIM-barrel fold metal-dependent hydrolase
MSVIVENWIAGRGLPDVLVIDGHIHISEWPHAATFRDAGQAAEESLRFLEANGVDAFCAVSGGYIWGMCDYRLGNNFLLDVWRRIPGHLIPFLGINPNDSHKNVLAELERMADAGVRCIKLLNDYQSYPGDGANLLALYEFAARRNMLVFNHAWREHEIRRIARLYPDIDFIFGHYWGGYQDEVMLEHPNVYANIWNYGQHGWLERGIARVGAGKFMFGSDGFLNALSVGIGPIVFAPVNDEERRSMLGLTMARLLHKVGALPAGLRGPAEVG